MLDKEAGGALDNLQRRYERDQDAIRDKIERGQQSIFLMIKLEKSDRVPEIS